MFQHVSGISVRCWIRCSNILARFIVPCFRHVCTGALFYLRKPYFLILLTKQRAYLYKTSCAIFLKMCLYFRKYLKLLWTFLKMFLHIRTFHICLWFLFCRSVGRFVLFWSPNRLNDPYYFSIKGRLQDLIRYSSRHSKSLDFRVLSLCVSTLVSLWCKFSTVLFVSLFCISLIHVKDCVLSCKLLCAPAKLF